MGISPNPKNNKERIELAIKMIVERSNDTIKLKFMDFGEVEQVILDNLSLAARFQARNGSNKTSHCTMNLTLLTIFGVFALLAVILAIIVEPEWHIYYDLRTNETIRPADTANPRLKVYKKHLENKLLRIGFGPIPCSCQSMTCGCCSGMRIQHLNFDRRACLNFTYDPQEFAINMDMLMNEDSLYSNSISAKNPPPLCIPMPIPYVPSVDLCVKFFNIHTSGNNIFMCMDFLTRIERAPLLILHFDCLQMGQDGVSHHKPDEEDLEVADIDEGSEIYDEVLEEEVSSNQTTSQPMVSTVKEGTYELETATEINQDIEQKNLEKDKELMPKEDNMATPSPATTAP